VRHARSVYKTKLSLQVHHLISELNDITAAEEGPVLPDGAWREKLSDNSRGLFNSFPRAIQEMLLLERDPHGNVQVRGLKAFAFAASAFAAFGSLFIKSGSATRGEVVYKSWAVFG
jgi:hypothetical protein